MKGFRNGLKTTSPWRPAFDLELTAASGRASPVATITYKPISCLE